MSAVSATPRAATAAAFPVVGKLGPNSPAIAAGSPDLTVIARSRAGHGGTVARHSRPPCSPRGRTTDEGESRRHRTGVGERSSFSQMDDREIEHQRAQR